jgi:hypothetical protein
MKTSINLKPDTIAYLLRLSLSDTFVMTNIIMDVLNNITPEDYENISNKFGYLRPKSVEYPFCLDDIKLTGCLKKILTLSQYESIKHLTNDKEI